MLAHLLVSAASMAEDAIPLEAWQNPPRELRPVARWWWPGGSVEAPALTRQLQQIRDAGFGAVEVQPLLLGLGDDDLAADPALRTVGEPAFGKRIASAAAAAQRIGLDFDFTLGSGWPGGLPTPKSNAERQLVMGVVDVTGPARFEGPLPAPPDQSYRGTMEWALDVLGPQDFETTLVALLAGRIGKQREGVPTLEALQALPLPKGDRIAWDAPEGRWRLFALYENSTEHFVMGGAFPGEEADARVVDHLSQRGADALLEGYGARVLDGVEAPVRELFVDSFELLGELPFTGSFLAEFRARAGYDLTPHLPLLFRRGGESKYAAMMDLFGQSGGPLYLAPEAGKAERIREDYERVRRELFEEHFVERIAQWARGRGLALRLQAHGGYGDVLDTYARAHVPESEALFAGGSFDFLKLASSAAHVAGRRWASSESFITMRLWGRRLGEEEMFLLAGRTYAAGINRLAFHGVPYPYERADGVRWYPFSGGFGRILAGPFPMSSEIDAAFLRELPEFNRFLARLSLAMSQGEPAADVAWLHAEPHFPDTASFQLGRIDPRAGESDTTRVLRARGLGHDRVSRRMLAGAKVRDGALHIGARRYRGLLLDPLEVADVALAERLVEIVEGGIPVFVLGALPQRAPGLQARELRDRRVRNATKQLEKRGIPAATPDRLETQLAKHVTSAVLEPIEGRRLEVSIERRHHPQGEILLLFNESFGGERAEVRFTRAGGRLVRWDPRSGTQRELRARVSIGDTIALELAPAETILLTLGRATPPASERERDGSPPPDTPPADGRR